MTEFSKALMVSTDVAHIVLFHPDDLAHADGVGAQIVYQ
jgi:hypothetical protein